MIYDGFLFFNELDVLKIRLVELAPVIDKFILVESDTTFQGASKPYYFDEHKQEFAEFLDKIIHIKLQDPGGFGSAWDREIWSRNCIEQGLDCADVEDILILSDVDEIPKRSTIAKLNPQPMQAIEMNVYVFRLNLFDALGHSCKAIRVGSITDLETMRRLPPANIIEKAGWHFSSLGTAEHISEKFKAFSHTEINLPEYVHPDNIQRRIDNHIDPIDRGTLTKVEIDDSWPEEIKQNKQYWEKYIC